MALTSGFFNSLNEDRPYDAEQISSIFDGIIEDGVYETLGNHFQVTPSEGMGVLVGTGRAWFDHTWTNNDTPLALELDSSEIGLNRIDLIVLEVNHSEETRANTIKVITGSPADVPVRPTPVKEAAIKQYPLASVYVPASSSAISTSNITNYVGTSECPFVIGVVEVMSVDMLTNQWKAEETEIFENWLSHLQHELDEDQIGHLQAQIDNVKPLTSSDIDSIWNGVYGGE